MRKLIVAGIAFVLLVGGFIAYMEIDKRKFIDSISSVSPVVDQLMNVSETTIEGTRENKKPKFQEVAPLLPSNRLDRQMLKALKRTVGRDCRRNNESRRNSCLTNTVRRRGFVI